MNSCAESCMANFNAQTASIVARCSVTQETRFPSCGSSYHESSSEESYLVCYS